MTASATSKMGAEAFKEHVRAYKKSFEMIKHYPGQGIKVTKKVDRENIGLENLEISDVFPEEVLKELPQEFEDIINFIERNWIAITNKNREKINKLLDLVSNLYKRFEKEIGQNLWSLLEEDVEAETLEYLHSLLTRSAREIRLLLDNRNINGLEEDPEVISKFTKRVNLLIKGLDKLLYTIENKSISKSEKREIDKILSELDEDYIGVSEGDEVEVEKLGNPITA